MAVALSITQIYLKIVYAFVFHGYVEIVYFNLSTQLEYACNITSPQGFWGKDEYPNPRKDVNYCGRNCTKSWVCDPAGILTSHQADDLDRTLDRIATSGNCRCTQCTSNEGHYIYVALMSRMKISEGQTKEMEAYAFSEHLKEKWMGGTCGNIVVIVVSTEDKQMPTNPGSEASAILTLECIKLIYNEVKPLVKTRGYYSALKSMIRRYKYSLKTLTFIPLGECHCWWTRSPRGHM
ncbi:hypothetical protein FSP39_014703 [Pinctada imbricata]|uniref:Uncharacterized protein n=1 Tax=Pinctada imbricata TaxID=66713 RepID=A0AA89CBV8_PINIB|nr:hypothetical protein FSP39_014703 [Pinctada imbricata]